MAYDINSHLYQKEEAGPARDWPPRSPSKGGAFHRGGPLCRRAGHPVRAWGGALR